MEIVLITVINSAERESADASLAQALRERGRTVRTRVATDNRSRRADAVNAGAFRHEAFARVLMQRLGARGAFRFHRLAQDYC